MERRARRQLSELQVLHFAFLVIFTTNPPRSTVLMKMKPTPRFQSAAQFRRSLQHHLRVSYIVDISILRITSQVFLVRRVSKVEENETTFASRVTRTSTSGDGEAEFLVDDDVVSRSLWSEWKEVYVTSRRS